MFETDPALNAGIIDEHIDSAKRIEPRNGVGDFRLIRYIEARSLDAQALCAQEICRGLEFLGVPTVQDHGGAMLCETKGKTVTDSAIGTGDEDTTSGEIEKVHWDASAYQRVRSNQYQYATIPEPLRIC